MKYRIKIYTYQNDRQEFFPQVLKRKFKIFNVWKNIGYDGQEMRYYITFDNRKEALECIDLHKEGNSSIKEIIFEYIN